MESPASAAEFTAPATATRSRAEPLPDGTVPKEDTWKRKNRFLWSWHDEQGDNKPQQEEIAFAATPENPQNWEWPMDGFTVDEKGWIWFASYVRRPPNPREESAILRNPSSRPGQVGKSDL